MKTNLKMIRKFLVIGIFMAIALLGMFEPAFAQKIHVLLVWGTNDAAPGISASKELIEQQFAGMGIRQGGKYIASFTSLSGYEASGQNILDHCHRMAQNAGPDDTVFVYMLCHGATVLLDSDPNRSWDNPNRIHVLSPLASNANSMDFRGIGIKRYSILKAMKGGNHRLNVLITDSCSRFNPNPVVTPRGSKGGSLPKLLCILLNSRGTINWNSSNPNGGRDGQGELSMVLKDRTIFTKPFLMISKQNCDPRNYTERDFFRELGSALVDDYVEQKEKSVGTTSYSTLIKQKQQTLTEFDDYGRVKNPWTEADRVNYAKTK